MFADLYRRLAGEGAGEILSVHLSSEVSGTFESAQLAARHAPVPVTCIDTRHVGVGTGYAVEAAASSLVRPLIDPDPGPIAVAPRPKRSRCGRRRI